MNYDTIIGYLNIIVYVAFLITLGLMGAILTGPDE